MLKGRKPKGKIVLNNDQEISKYRKANKLKRAFTFDTPVTDEYKAAETHLANQDTWCYPKEYEELDILEYALSLCKTQQEKERIELEYLYFVSADAIPLLKYILYILSICVEHDVVWGVGRGSSVSSYLLYKLGVHCVDSLEYGLEFSEFAKDF